MLMCCSCRVACAQFCGINDNQCTASAASWNISRMPSIVMYRDREQFSAIMDSELCLESQADLPSREGFKFMAGLASYHSKHIMHMTQVWPCADA